LTYHVGYVDCNSGFVSGTEKMMYRRGMLCAAGGL
jgi:hypothetical protein